ncbi:MAG: hypothetical protein IPK82_04155 [Polyangiaceae bacterium]|nr:hypothetical protein [Polyangiaceae bacterium]
MVGTKSRFVLALAVLLVPGVALSAAPVTVKGRLAGTQKLLNPVWNEAKEPTSHAYTFREPSVTTRTDARNLTAQLDKEVAIVAVSDAGGVKVKGNMVVMGGRISPVTLVITQGETVQIENKDPFPHKLYDTGNKGLQVGETPANKARSWAPPGPGTYEIRDQAAPSVRAWIVVEPKAVAVTYPDRKGEFGIDLEPGKYKLRAYHNGVVVGKEMDFVVNPAPAEQPLKSPLLVSDEPKKDEKK